MNKFEVGLAGTGLALVTGLGVGLRAPAQYEETHPNLLGSAAISDCAHSLPSATTVVETLPDACASFRDLFLIVSTRSITEITVQEPLKEPVTTTTENTSTKITLPSSNDFKGSNQESAARTDAAYENTKNDHAKKVGLKTFAEVEAAVVAIEAGWILTGYLRKRPRARKDSGKVSGNPDENKDQVSLDYALQNPEHLPASAGSHLYKSR